MSILLRSAGLRFLMLPTYVDPTKETPSSHVDWFQDPYATHHSKFTKFTQSNLSTLPDLKLNGRGAHKSAIPLAVLSVYRGVSCKKG